MSADDKAGADFAAGFVTAVARRDKAALATFLAADDFCKAMAALNKKAPALNVKACVKELNEPAPRAGPFRSVSATLAPMSPRLAWPRLFHLEPSDTSFTPRADFVIDNRAHIHAAPELVFDEMVTLAHGREWLEHFVDVKWLGAGTAPLPPDPRVIGRTSDQAFTFMTLRIQIILAERGRRMVSTVDSCSLPLAKWMVEEVTFEPTADGGTDFHWVVSSQSLRATRLFQPMIEPLFRDMFRKSTERLATFCGKLASQGS